MEMPANPMHKAHAALRSHAKSKRSGKQRRSPAQSVAGCLSDARRSQRCPQRNGQRQLSA